MRPGSPFARAGAHVVVPHHLEHRRAREPGQEADVEGREDERRQDDVVERLPEESEVAFQQRVDRVQAGDVVRRVDTRVETSGAREPVELVEADVQRDERDPERRHRDACE